MRGGEGPRAEHRLEGHYPMGPGESVEPEESELSEDTDLSDTQEPADEETSPLQ
jgi:hypothetical protein